MGRRLLLATLSSWFLFAARVGDTTLETATNTVTEEFMVRG